MMMTGFGNLPANRLSKRKNHLHRHLSICRKWVLNPFAVKVSTADLIAHCFVCVLCAPCVWSFGIWGEFHPQFRSQSTKDIRISTEVTAFIDGDYFNRDVGSIGVEEETTTSEVGKNSPELPSEPSPVEEETGSLGDIMSEPNKSSGLHSDATKSKSYVVPPNSKSSVVNSGLVTRADGTLQDNFGVKVRYLSPLDRIALTANGNLQRIFSSYYDSPVHVHVHWCLLVSTSSADAAFLASPQTAQKGLNQTSGKPLQIPIPPAVWHRQVHLSVHDQKFCTATSEITVYSEECVQLVHGGTVGIGQLFRHLGILPTFALLDAGRTSQGGLWRIYELCSKELSCRIKEEFVPNAWEIQS